MTENKLFIISASQQIWRILHYFVCRNQKNKKRRYPTNSRKKVYEKRKTKTKTLIKLPIAEIQDIYNLFV
jgi:hypothetical protein